MIQRFRVQLPRDGYPSDPCETSGFRGTTKEEGRCGPEQALAAPRAYTVKWIFQWGNLFSEQHTSLSRPRDTRISFRNAAARKHTAIQFYISKDRLRYYRQKVGQSGSHRLRLAVALRGVTEERLRGGELYALAGGGAIKINRWEKWRCWCKGTLDAWGEQKHKAEISPRRLDSCIVSGFHDQRVIRKERKTYL